MQKYLIKFNQRYFPRVTANMNVSLIITIRNKKYFKVLIPLGESLSLEEINEMIR